MSEPLKYTTSGNSLNASSIDRESILKAVKEATARFDKASGPDMSRAYLVVPPDFLGQMKREMMLTEPFEVETHNDGRDALRYSLMSFGMPVMVSPYLSVRSIVTCGDSPSLKRVIWKDRPAVEPTSLWQYFVLVVALITILLLAFTTV